MIIWDPLRQYPNQFELNVCYEQSCKLRLRLLTWQDGRKSRYTPRCLYGLHGWTVLVCQIYTCPNNHYITTCDPRVLKLFAHKSCLPFVLLHRSGLTREAYHTIFNMACQGSSFSDIENFFLGQYQERHNLNFLTYSIMCQEQHCVQNIDQHPPFPTKYMSNDLIMELFIMMYKTMKSFLVESMASLTAECLSCDHTFKLPKHIGLLRGGKWVVQYDSLFVILVKYSFGN